MELLLAGVGVWAVLAVGFGIVLGRSARDADASELVDVPEPTAATPPAELDPDAQVG